MRMWLSQCLARLALWVRGFSPTAPDRREQYVVYKPGYEVATLACPCGRGDCDNPTLVVFKPLIPSTDALLFAFPADTAEKLGRVLVSVAAQVQERHVSGV
jgi:hypothetical protein